MIDWLEAKIKEWKPKSILDISSKSELPSQDIDIPTYSLHPHDIFDHVKINNPDFTPPFDLVTLFGFIGITTDDLARILICTMNTWCSGMGVICTLNNESYSANDLGDQIRDVVGVGVVVEETPDFLRAYWKAKS